ncbi:MAG: response regulator transcription factor [Chloroflexi bacterium]|nr:response regulator transcription factor [Chloroflexota bacterium]MBI3761059.1 response regulator transcription factor [Chloroflexota bacterium]
MAEKILVIDDDMDLTNLVGQVLRKEGFEAIGAASASQGLRAAFEHHPSLILLDVVMPDMDGWETCRRLRELSDIPIIFMSAHGAVEDVVKGLSLGGDDFLVKPTPFVELVARVRACLRRSPERNHTAEITFGQIDFKMNFSKREVLLRGHRIDLSSREFDLLAALVRNTDRVISREELVSEAWGPEGEAAVDRLKLYILNLRRKLERNPRRPEMILTVRGIGYRFNPN